MVDPQVDDIVQILFYDHMLGSDNLIHCVVYGRVYTYTPSSITIDQWHPVGNDYDRELKDNTECVTIIRSSIFQYRKLVEEKE